VYLTAFFTNVGVPSTGLNPTIRIRRISDGTLLVTDAVMTEVGDGWYRYWFAAYDEDVNYAIRCDGGATLPAMERYTYGGNENYIDDIDEKLSVIHGVGSWESDTTSTVDANIIQVQGNTITNVDDFKADVAALAIEANVEGHVTTSITTYDPPTRTEATSDKDEIINTINADSTSIVDANIIQVQGNSVTNIDDFKADVSALAIEANVEGHVTDSLNTYDPPTRTEATSDKDEIINTINADSTSIVIADVQFVNGVPVLSIDEFKADVSALAIEANVEGHVTNSLTTYDPPTRTEATSDKDEILTAVNADSTNVVDANIIQVQGNTITNVDDFKADVAALAIEANVEGHVTNSLNTYDSPTRTEATSDKDEILVAVNADSTSIVIADVQFVNGVPVLSIDEFKADVSALAIEANVETHVTNSLNTYDPPTRTEATSDKDEILVAVGGGDSTSPVIADIRFVNGVPVTSVDDFKADVSTISTLIRRVLGLVQENFYIDQIIYDANNAMTASRVRTYSVGASVGTNANVLATYNVEVVYDANGNMESYRVIIL